jgi:hypothetical protein
MSGLAKPAQALGGVRQRLTRTGPTDPLDNRRALGFIAFSLLEHRSVQLLRRRNEAIAAPWQGRIDRRASASM